jgi:AraC-like DNA-binding protein
MITPFSNFNEQKARVQRLYTTPVMDMALCGYERPSEDEFFMPHAALTCVRQGRKTVYLDGKKHEMKEGDILYIPKHAVIYSDIPVKDRPFLSLNTVIRDEALPGNDPAAILGAIAATLNHPQPLALLARLHHMSVSTLKRWALRNTGGSLHQWIIQRRLERAHYLLEHKRLPVSQACHESGFQDVSYFIRQFRERFGVTPGSFRN